MNILLVEDDSRIVSIIERGLTDEGCSLSSVVDGDAALREASGIVAHAAERLQIRRTTLSEKMKRYGIALDTQ